MKPTPLKAVTGFVTSDGTFFEQTAEFSAAAHQRNIDFRKWCYENICRGGEWSSDMVASEILENWKVENK